MKLYKKIIKKGTLTLISGLHIGDSKDNTEIGGVDSPICRRKDNNEPYIPGSSLKGKMRSLLDIANGIADSTKDSDSIIGRLFGTVNNDKATPSRLIVRDSFLTEESRKKLEESKHTDMPYTEVKFENTIDRIKGTASNPRQIERVPAGSVFNIEFVINIIASSEADATANEQEYLNTLNAAIIMLEDDYLGGSGSRGYGQVKIEMAKTLEKKSDEYFIV